MSWADIAKKNKTTPLGKLEKKPTLKKQRIDLYPEDLFDIRYINELRKLKQDMENVVHTIGIPMLDNDFTLSSLYEFVVYHTNLDYMTDELLQEGNFSLENESNK